MRHTSNKAEGRDLLILKQSTGVFGIMNINKFNRGTPNQVAETSSTEASKGLIKIFHCGHGQLFQSYRHSILVVKLQITVVKLISQNLNV